MKLGVLTALFSSSPLEAALDRVKAHDLDAVELGTGNYPGDAHCNPDELLDNGAKLEGLRHAVASRGLVISALSCHGNPLHPSRDIARDNHETFIKTVRLARRLDVDRVCLFSGCPGDSDNARYPNWVTCAWPTEYKELVEWQWTEKVIPYWREQAAFSASHGVRLCFEMHPGFAVYNPETLLRLRSAAGETVGANFDPSHLYWQGIDPAAAIRTLGDARSIFHVHAKDTMINKTMTSQNGVLDTKPLSDARTRSWIFRTVGYGHDQLHWREIISALRTAGYDDVLSIEHEDLLASVDEGFESAVGFLKNCLFKEPPTQAWWT